MDSTANVSAAPMLEHLVVYPRSGLCNRMRAIASAKRLCVKAGARCTVIWDWGDYRALFDDDTDWMPHARLMDPTRKGLMPWYHQIRHASGSEGGNRYTCRVPLTTHSHIVVSTPHVFGAVEESPLTGRERPVLPWLPRPSASILDRVRTFQRDHFPPRIVGIHIRRTDNTQAIAGSPDRAYFRRANRAVDRGYQLFLATDNDATTRAMHLRYGTKLIQYPKSSTMERRWPRHDFVLSDVFDDFVDLWLLASCDLVIGTPYSSYSRIAMLLNGSPHCEAVDRLLLPRLRRRVGMLRSGKASLRSLSAHVGLWAQWPWVARDDLPAQAGSHVTSGEQRLQAALERLQPAKWGP
jgi:hypothetical protein